MSKSIRYFIIFISICSIVFSVFSMIKGQTFLDASGGIAIGLCLLGVLFVEKKEKNN